MLDRCLLDECRCQSSCRDETLLSNDENLPRAFDSTFLRLIVKASTQVLVLQNWSPPFACGTLILSVVLSLS